MPRSAPIISAATSSTMAIEVVTRNPLRIAGSAAGSTIFRMIAACDSPHGLAIDTETRRLFTSCVNSKLLVINAIDGAIVSTLPIGKYTDAAAYDPRTKRVFSSNGDGTLTVIQQEGANRYKSLGEVATQLGARTMAIDPTSGRIFMLTGEYKTVDPSAKDLRQRYSVEPGSVRVLILEQAAVH